MNAQEVRWFENENFWNAMEQKIYSSEIWRNASRETEEAIVLLKIVAPNRILDMCCGTGRHSIELAKRGYQVTGIDLNSSYIDSAKANAIQKGQIVNFVQGDMRSFQSEETYAAAMILWNAFGYFETDEEDITALRKIHAGLQVNGKLLIQTHGRETTARKFVRKDWFELDTKLVLDQRWIENDWSRMRTRYIILDEKGRQELTMSCRIYSPDQITGLLKSAGFGRVKIYGALNGIPYDEKAFELVAVATRSN